MISVEFSAEALEEIQYYSLNHPHPRVQQKMWSLWLKSHQIPHAKICELVGITDNTLRAYLRSFIEGGVEELKKLSFYRPTSVLDEHWDTLEVYFSENPPSSAAQAIEDIHRITGIKRGLTQTRAFMHRLGLDFRKVGAVPSKVDPLLQEEFIKKELEPRLEEAKRGQRKVYFVDAAHFVMGSFLGWLWCFKRIFIRSSSGRNRFNVLGALCAITHELITICNTDYINAESVCELLTKTRQNLGDSLPITLVLDNARYQKCKLVWSTAQSLRIELLYLPPYSPNLNLIERFWKFTKKKVLYSRYYETFVDFQNAIKALLESAADRYVDELDTLLTLNFQSFENIES